MFLSKFTLLDEVGKSGTTQSKTRATCFVCKDLLEEWHHKSKYRVRACTVVHDSEKRELCPVKYIVRTCSTGGKVQVTQLNEHWKNSHGLVGELDKLQLNDHGLHPIIHKIVTDYFQTFIDGKKKLPTAYDL